MGSERVCRAVSVFLLQGLLVFTVWLAAAPAADAYRGWQHATAVGRSSCNAGCHFQRPPTNASCTGCHTGFAVSGGQWCWTCHEPGQRTSDWQSAEGCTSGCHLWTGSSESPSYLTPYAHSESVHLGAAGFGETCVDCHGVSLEATRPGTSPHHDAVENSAPSCAGCHDGGIASAPSGHDSFGDVCTACHTGMDRPSGDCAACHVGATGTDVPQIDYTNELACADAGCHGLVEVHAATPVGELPCTTCHTGHYAELAACEVCHPAPEAFHHGTTVARPLADCAGCHDGGIAPARASHSTLKCAFCHIGMSEPGVPAVCSQCHFVTRFGTGVCTGCHGASGLTGFEQVHSGAPGAGLTCTTCHSAHRVDLGDCSMCHARPPEVHHGVTAVAGSVLTLGAKPARLGPGDSTVLRGSLADAGGAAEAGAQVLLQERRLSRDAFTDLATLTTGVDGTFSRAVQPVAGTVYRAVFRGASSATGVAVQGPAIAEVKTTMRQRVRLTARPTTLRRGARVRLAGRVAPAPKRLGASRPAVSLRVKRKNGGRWVQVASAKLTLKADGGYSWAWRPRKAGAYRVTVSAAATAELLAASARVRLRVR